MCLERLVLVAAVTCLLLNLPTSGQITVDPNGFAMAIEEGGEAGVELVLSNSGENDVAFSVEAELIVDEDNRRRGPRRDDPGDVIAQYQKPYNQIHGLAWDYDHNWMWGVGFEQHLYAMDLANDREVVVDVQVQNQMAGMFYHDGLLHIGGWGGGANNIFRWDTEGNQVERLVLPVNPGLSYIASDDEHIFTNDFGNTQILVFNLDDQEQVATMDFGEATNGNGAWSIEWVTAHSDGQLWLVGLNRLYECFVDDEWNIEHVQDFGIIQGTNSAIAHDGENMWIGKFDNPFNVVDDGVREFHMLAFDPEEGIIPAQDSETVGIVISAVDCEPGVYNMLIYLELSEREGRRDDLEQSIIQISAVVSVGDPTFDIAGTVTNAADDSPVEGVSVALDRYIITRLSDGEGAYAHTDLPPGEYVVSFSATDYLPTTEEVTIADEDIDLDVALLHADFNPDPDGFESVLEPNLRQDFDLVVSNPGNGPLTYIVERQLIGDANADPWELRNEINAEEISGDTQLNGVVVVNSLIYVSGGNNGENINLIHVFDQEGNLVNQFEQFFESRYGMRDLTYDGTLIWGADGTTLYGFTTEGELVQAINGQARSYRALAWDADRQVFWSADVTSDIFETDLDGNQVGVIDVPVETRVYGLSYWADDPDGYCLYFFSRGDVDSVECQVNKLNVETSERLVVAPLADVAGRPGGFDVTNQYDVYSWVVVGMVQSPDRVMVWQLEGRRDWFRIEPTAGQIAAEASEDFVVTLDATGLPAGNVFRGEIVFIHDGVGSRTVLPVTLSVVEGEVRTTRELELEMGWNTVSVNLQPDEEDVTVLTQPLVDAGLLEIMKDDEGRFYIPAFGHNSIPGWYVQEGYMLKVSEATTLELAGVSVLRDRPIPLHEGWQLISYYPNFPVEATLALTNIVDNLIIAKDGWGNFYVPAWDYSNLGDMVRGQGYYLKMSAEDELVYTIAEGDGRQVAQASCLCKGRLPGHVVTGENMSLLVKADADAEIAVYAGSAFVGSGVLHDGVCGIAVWGDDPTTKEIDGARDGQALTLMVNDADDDVDVDGGIVSANYRVLTGEMVYKTDALAVVELEASNAMPTEFAITSAYPNPFNSVMRIGYALPEVTDVRLAVYDVTGRLVSELVRGRMQAGMHMTVFDGAALSSGVYVVRLDAAGRTSQVKVALVK